MLIKPRRLTGEVICLLKRQLQFVHVGKCGGSTIFELLSRSPVVAERYSSFFESHINGVKVTPDCDYLICLRNPIDRAFSAFEWRKKLVLDDALPEQVDRFSGESEVLRGYGDLGKLSKSLYRSDGRLNQVAARDFQLIHHLRESIAYYLRPLLPVLSPDNVLGIICQETLATDCARLLGVSAQNLFFRRNDSKRQWTQHLDQEARSCLRRYLADDYQCITSLWALGVLDDAQLMRLILD